MKKSTMLTRLALAGIAAGLVSAAPAHASGHGKKAADSVKAGKHSCGGPGGCGAKKDSVLGKKIAADSTGPDTVKQVSCRGHNECKGLGGCAMSEKQLQEAAKRLGIPRDKAGKPHSCKGKNECKGLGGCNM